MIILGIDPSLRSTGYGIVEVQDNQVKYLYSGTILTNPKLELSRRLLEMSKQINQVIQQYQVELACCETMFLSKNFKSVMKMAHVRGVIFSALANHEVEIYEYSPREIKKSITGNGNASKDQVKFMITRILQIDDSIGYDQSDALAVALTLVNRKKIV